MNIDKISDAMDEQAEAINDKIEAIESQLAKLSKAYHFSFSWEVPGTDMRFGVRRVGTTRTPRIIVDPPGDPIREASLEDRATFLVHSAEFSRAFLVAARRFYTRALGCVKSGDEALRLLTMAGEGDEGGWAMDVNKALEHFMGAADLLKLTDEERAILSQMAEKRMGG